MDKELLENMIRAGFTTGQRLLATNMNPGSLRTNATLRKDEWLVLDTAIIEDAQDRLVGYQDLLSRGLTFGVVDGLGTMVLESENVNDMRDAELDMDAMTENEDDTVNFEIVGIPLPIISKSYRISIRKLHASRRRGESLDTTQARLSSRKVADKQESILFLGTSSFKYSGYTIYGYTDFPSRQTGSVTAAWASTTGANIVTDVLAMKQDAIDKKQYGPFVFYVPTDVETNLDNDYSSTKGTNTIRDRILAVTGVEDIKVADKLSTGNVLCVTMTRETVRAIEGLPLTNVEWEEKGGLATVMKVMTITVPQLRTDQSANSGIIHYS